MRQVVVCIFLGTQESGEAVLVCPEIYVRSQGWAIGTIFLDNRFGCLSNLDLHVMLYPMETLAQAAEMPV